MSNKYIDFILQNRLNNNINGKIAATFNKSDLSNNGVTGIIIDDKAALSKYDNDLTHWTPNIYKYLQYNKYKKVTKHSKDNLKVINTYVIDIDIKYDFDLLIDKLKKINQSHDLVCPNLIIESPRGWQLYYVLDKPFYVTKDSLKVAETVHKNMLGIMQHELDVDFNANAFGFYRYPNNKNVKYYKDQYINKDDLVNWSIKYNVVDHKLISFDKYNTKRKFMDKWVIELLKTKNITDKQGFQVCRNNTMFTLALYFYANDYNFEETYKIISDYNKVLNKPLKENEINSIMRSSFSGKYKAPSLKNIKMIMQKWVKHFDVNTIYSNHFYKHKKDRIDRIYSHYDERTKDLIDYLNKVTDQNNVYININIKDLLAKIDMPKSSFYDILNKLVHSNVIWKVTKTKGRYSKSKIALFVNVVEKIKKIIRDNKNKKVKYSQYLKEVIEELLITPLEYINNDLINNYILKFNSQKYKVPILKI